MRFETPKTHIEGQEWGLNSHSPKSTRKCGTHHMTQLKKDSAHYNRLVDYLIHDFLMRLEGFVIYILIQVVAMILIYLSRKFI
jgi:hypothetical protein